jgi:hypothetical protein
MYILWTSTLCVITRKGCSTWPWHFISVISWSAEDGGHLVAVFATSQHNIYIPGLQLVQYSLSGGWSPTGSTRHGGHWLTYCSLPLVIMMMENFGGMKIGRETEVLGGNPPQHHFVRHKSHLTRPAQPFAVCECSYYFLPTLVRPSTDGSY